MGGNASTWTNTLSFASAGAAAAAVSALAAATAESFHWTNPFT